MYRTSVLFLLVACISCAQSNLGPTTGCGGSGTASDPYLICSTNAFSQISTTANVYYKQTVPLVISASNYLATFNGFYDGNNLSITGAISKNLVGINNGTIKNIIFSNITLTSTSTPTGIIGRNNGTVQNISITGSSSFSNSSTSATDFGSLVGNNYGTMTSVSLAGTSTVTMTAPINNNNCYFGGIVGNNFGTIQGATVTNTVQITASTTSAISTYTGGIVGFNNGTISQSSISNASGFVTRGYSVGGIAGSNWGTISKCSNIGVQINSTTSLASVGGIAGSNVDGQVLNSSNTGAITGSGFTNMSLGGIVGWNDKLSGSGGLIQDCYNNSTLSSGQFQVGGIVGSNAVGKVNRCHAYSGVSAGGGTWYGQIAGNNIDTITFSYFNSSATASPAVGTGSSTGTTGLTSSQMAVQANFAGWDFVSTWIMGAQFPILQ